MPFPFTPNKKHDADAKNTAKTPSSWANALGIFSAKKSTPATSVNGGFSSGRMSAGTGNNSDIDEFQSPLSSHVSPGGATGNNSFSIGTSPTTRGGQRKPSRLESSTRKSEQTTLVNGRTYATSRLSTNRVSFGSGSQSAFRSSKSPRTTRSIMPPAETTTVQGNRRINSGTTAVSFLSSKQEPTGRYRPSSTLLTGSKGGQRFRKRGKLDNNGKFGQALNDVRDLFLPSDMQDTSTNIFSTKGGMMWGSLDRPSRFTQKIQKRQRPAEKMQAANDEDEEGDSRRKRRKKVMFDQEAENANAFTTTISATPHRSNNSLNRKATPMPAKTSQVSFESPANREEEVDDVEEQSVPSAQRLPSATSPCDFDVAALDSDEPGSVKLPLVNAFDAVAPDPQVNALAFHAKLQTSNPTAQGLVSTTSRTDYEEKRYERPPSPVRTRTSRTTLDDGDAQATQKTQKRTKVGSSQATEVIPDWICTKCGTKNNNDETLCQKEGCGNVRTASGTSQGWGSLFANINQGKWKCPACNSLVDDNSDACLSCDEKKPQGWKCEGCSSIVANECDACKNCGKKKPANAKPTQPNTAPVSNDIGLGAASSGSKFLFQAPTPGSSAAPSTSGNAFGLPSVSGKSTGGFFQASQSSWKEEEKKTEASTPASSTQTGAGVFMFGGTPVPNSSSANSSFMKVPGSDFGNDGKQNGGSPKTASVSKPFESKFMGENGDKKQVKFGTTPSSDETGEGQSGFSSFGSTSTPTDPQAASTTASQFAVPDSTVGGPFGSSSGSASATSGYGGFSGGQFGSTSASETEGKPKRQRGYELINGIKPNGTKTPPQVAPTLFGAPAPATPASGTTFQFGTASTSKDTEDGSGNATQFGNPIGGGMQSGTATGSSMESQPFKFGATPSAPAPSAPGGFKMASGAPMPTPAFGSGTPIPAFGSAKTTTPSAPAFGSMGTTPAPAATSFGTTPAAAPSAADFGTAPATGFGSTPAPATGFGSTPAPSTTFGSTPAPATGFGPTTTGFNPTAFGGNSTAATGFGSGATTPANFGSNNPPAATPAPAFASHAGTGMSSGGFGSASFGTQTPAASNQGFNTAAFGSNAAPTTGGFGATPSPGGLGLNGFGAPQTGGFQSTPAPTGGFNGGGYGATAPNTAPPGAGFNIGSSGPKPKRRVVRAKRPTRPA